MCYRAWIFAAGLVLGFSLLAPPELLGAIADTKRSFFHSHQLLENMSRLSPQARRYHEILSHFSDAVEQFQRQRRRQDHQTGSSYLEQILRPERGRDDGTLAINSEKDVGPSITVAPTSDRGQMSNQRTTPGGTVAEPPSPLVSGSVDETFLWPQAQSDMLFAPEISDELGMQLPWDEYVSQFAQDVASTGTLDRVSWDPMDGTFNSG